MPGESYFWTKETFKKMFDKEDSDEEDEEEPEDITEEKLNNIITYLRAKYLYCVYCAITGENETDLETNCPGPNREDHEDMN